MKNTIKKLFRKSERGQSIVLIALVFVGLLAFIGLTVDLGMLFISYGSLRRAVDSASLAAATQMRQDYSIQDLKDAAAQFLRLNNVQVDDATVDVQTCATNPTDTELCPTDKRKLVRVTASVPVTFSFLPVIGFYGTTITANAMAEAASMDVVLVLDISESMTDDAVDYYMKDPANCNNADPSDAGDHPEIPYNATYPTIPGECHPFEEVKAAAGYKMNKWILNLPKVDEEDRLAVVVFSDGWHDPSYEMNGQIPTKGTAVVCPNDNIAGDPTNSTNLVGGKCRNPWINDYDQAFNLITHLKVFQPPRCATTDYDSITDPGNCTRYPDPVASPATDFYDLYCPLYSPDNHYWDGHGTLDGTGDGSTCQTTNIGGGLQLAASLFGINMRKDALWLVILLTDGAANATEVTHTTDPNFVDSSNNIITSNLVVDAPIGYCPTTLLGGTVHENEAGCRDWDYTSANQRHPQTSPNYDAEDYARDMADLVSCDGKSPKAGCNSAGQSAIMFAIGLGQTVQKTVPSGTARPGDTLLRYIQAVGDDGDPSTNACGLEPLHNSSYTCGNYYYAQTSSDLNPIFDQIASRIFTRLTQ